MHWYVLMLIIISKANQPEDKVYFFLLLSSFSLSLSLMPTGLASGRTKAQPHRALGMSTGLTTAIVDEETQLSEDTLPSGSKAPVVPTKAPTRRSGLTPIRAEPIKDSLDKQAPTSGSCEGLGTPLGVGTATRAQTASPGGQAVSNHSMTLKRGAGKVGRRRSDGAAKPSCIPTPKSRIPVKHS